jgi:hypothetical protein
MKWYDNPDGTLAIKWRDIEKHQTPGDDRSEALQSQSDARQTPSSTPNSSKLELALMLVERQTQRLARTTSRGVRYEPL